MKKRKKIKIKKPVQKEQVLFVGFITKGETTNESEVKKPSDQLELYK